MEYLQTLAYQVWHPSKNHIILQLLMSLTMTLVDEENIRQRLLEIRKSRLRRTMVPEMESLASKFQVSSVTNSTPLRPQTFG